MATPTTTSIPSSTNSTSSPSCTTAVPDRYGYVPADACNAQWAYSPSFTSAVAFSVVFGLATLSHILLAILHRKPFCWVIIMGTVWELSAFILRSLASHNQQNSTYAIISQILFLLTPLWINAFVYMTTGRLVYMLHPNKSIWKFKAVSMGKWFVWLDILSFLVQAAGGLMLSPEYEPNITDIGKTIYMSGLALQQFFILLFLALIVRFHLDALNLDGQGLLCSQTGNGNKRWRYLTYTLYTVLVLITMRIIFRVVEFSGGMDPKVNQLPYKEGFALGLDAFPMALAVVLFALVHPGLVLKGSESELPSRMEKKANKKAKREAKKILRQAKNAGLAEGMHNSPINVRKSNENLGSESMEMESARRTD
ncbi:RTA1 like protein-domain-containing protein [Pyrenochaeta sp. MPI-SDFR-AT-0127]|nr:RTA1 like protein-domain-containing protein [Pyrenochaeta sp. MPI-SDFR-AT-0127]